MRSTPPASTPRRRIIVRGGLYQWDVKTQLVCDALALVAHSLEVDYHSGGNRPVWR